MTSFYEELHKKDALSDEKENKKSRDNIDKWIFRLLLLLIGFMPLIVMANVETVISPLISNLNVLTSGIKGELFTHYKAIFIVVVTLITGAMLLTKVFFMEGTIHKTILNLLLGTFVIAIILSTVLSSNITTALNGQYNRSDGAISWLCYLALMFIAMNINYPQKALNYILYSLYPFVVINLYIITMNFYGKDLLQNEVIKKSVMLFLPEGAQMGEGSFLVGTLNQWNYMSGMFAIMAVMFLAAAILEKKVVIALGHLIIAIMSTAIILMSISTSGFLTASIMMFLVLYIALKSEHKMRSFIMIVVFFIVNIPIFHILASKDAQVWSESIGFLVKSNPYIQEEEVADSKMMENYQIPEWGARAYASEKFELPILPERAYGAGSGRIYIWQKTFAISKERPLFGYGLDTLIYNFPHNNIDSRAAYWYDNVITDKPHNMYVGWLYGTGLVGLISALALIALTFLKPLKKAFKDNNAIIWVLGIAWSAYLIQALFNDSLPGTSAPMWAIAGILLANTLKKKGLNNGEVN